MKALILIAAMAVTGCAEINPMSSHFSEHAGQQAVAQINTDSRQRNAADAQFCEAHPALMEVQTAHSVEYCHTYLSGTADVEGWSNCVSPHSSRIQNTCASYKVYKDHGWDWINR